MVVYETISEGKGEKPKEIMVTYDDYPIYDNFGCWVRYQYYYWACIMPKYILGEEIPIREEKDFSGDPDELRKIAEEISQEYPEYLVYILWHE